MRINGIAGTNPLGFSPSSSVSPTKGGFAELLRRSVSDLAEIQAAGDRAAQSIAVGDLSRLHEAVIAIQKASLALEFAISVRNHVVEGVQELLHTQT